LVAVERQPRSTRSAYPVEPRNGHPEHLCRQGSTGRPRPAPHHPDRPQPPVLLGGRAAFVVPRHGTARAARTTRATSHNSKRTPEGPPPTNRDGWLSSDGRPGHGQGPPIGPVDSARPSGPATCTLVSMDLEQWTALDLAYLLAFGRHPDLSVPRGTVDPCPGDDPPPWTSGSSSRASTAPHAGSSPPSSPAARPSQWSTRSPATPDSSPRQPEPRSARGERTR